MENESSGMAQSQTTEAAEEKQTTSGPELNPTSLEGQQKLVESFLRSKEFISAELNNVFTTAKEGIVKEITASVMEQLNKKLEENMQLTASTYKQKNEEEEGVDKIIAGAKEMKMTY